MLENCFPGTAAGSSASPPTIAAGGIEGFATSQSINHGELGRPQGQHGGRRRRSTSRSTAAATTAARARACSRPSQRPGHRAAGLRQRREHDGSARLLELVASPPTISTTTTLAVTASTCCGSCATTPAPTTRSSSSSATTAARASVLYGVPIATYQAYNNYGGKSLYTFNSTGNDDRLGHRSRGEGVVRPAVRAAALDGLRDWYTRTDYRDGLLARAARATTSRTVSNTDLERERRARREPRGLHLAAHDEYFSAGMRTRARAGARRRRRPLLQRLERGLLEDPVREQPRPGGQTASRSATRPPRAAAPTRAASRPAPGATPRGRTSPRTP